MSSEDFFKRIDTSKLYPRFLAKLQQLIQDLADAGTPYFVICGERTYAEQDALYAKGRTVPGGRVTNAKAGFSAHCFSVAADCVRDGDLEKPGLQPNWNASQYKPYADHAKELGLEPGLYWKSFVDADHVQLPLTSKGITMAQLDGIYKKGGKEAVFAFLDQYEW